MELRAVRAAGPAYLALVTELLQRQRVTDATARLWEAADLQWWYTRDPHPSDEDAVFWVDGGGAPVVAAVFTRWSPTRYGCDMLGDTGHGPAWAYVRERCAGLGRASVEMGIAPGDEVTAREAERAAAVLALRPGAEFTEIGELFWADARTGVGLVEPMRVEDEHSGRGVAVGLLRAGLDRLAGRGCRRLKVSHDPDNEPARRLYHGAGFTAQMRVPTLVRPAAP